MATTTVPALPPGQHTTFINRPTIKTIDATQAVASYIALRRGRSYLVTVAILAKNLTDSDNQTAGYVLRATYRNSVGGTVSLVGSVTSVYSAEDNAAWDATLAIVGETVVINVTGAAAKNILWMCDWTVQELGISA